MKNKSTTIEEVVNTNLERAERELRSQSKFITIPEGSSAILQFIPSKPIEQVTDNFKGQAIRKIQFIAIELNCGNEAERIFKVGKRSAQLILAELRKGHYVLRIEREGSGSETLYRPTPVSSE